MVNPGLPDSLLMRFTGARRHGGTVSHDHLSDTGVWSSPPSCKSKAYIQP
jgi:hypothetical protein